MIRSMTKERCFILSENIYVQVRKYIRHQKLDPGKEEVEWTVGFTRRYQDPDSRGPDYRHPLAGGTYHGNTLRKAIRKTRLEMSKQLVPGFKKVHERTQRIDKHYVYTLGNGKTVESAEVFSNGVQLKEDEDFIIDGGAIVLLGKSKFGGLSFRVRDQHGMEHRL